MNDTAYINAINRKKALEAELREVEHFLSLYQRYAGAHEERPIDLARECVVEDAAERRSEPAKPTKPFEYADLAEKYIREIGHPLTRTELVEQFHKHGVKLPSEDEGRYLGTILWRNWGRFINVPGRGYFLEDMLTPEDQIRIEQSTRVAQLSEEEWKRLEEVARAQAQRPMLPKTRHEILAEWNANEQIASEFDRYLLGAAKNALSKQLSADQKHRLREMYIMELGRVDKFEPVTGRGEV